MCQEKIGDKTEARKYYEQYLKQLPEGPFAKEAHASLERLRERGERLSYEPRASSKLVSARS